MQAPITTQNGFTAVGHGKAPEAGSLGFLYAVYISGGLAGRFDDISDALVSARIAKHEHPMA